MTSPAGRAASRDLDLQLRSDGNIQESQLPPGFSLEKIESMIRELRTAAALEVSSNVGCTVVVCLLRFAALLV